MTSSPGPPPPDLLVAGEDRRGWQWTAARRRAAAVAVAVAAAVAAGVLVVEDRERDEQRARAVADRDVVALSLLAPGQDGAPRYGPRRAGVQLVVANTGPSPVRLLRGTLTPGGWQVDVPADRELRPGRSLVLALTPPRGCGRPEPRRLRLEARPASGRTAQVAFDVSGAQLAYGGTLDDAVRAAALGCDPTAPRDSHGRPGPQRSEGARPSR